MGSDVELIVLSMGLALHDIFAVQFFEDEDYSIDRPNWVKSSPLGITDAEELMDLWRKQLPAEKDSVDDSDLKGKGKEKATHPPNKRKGVPPIGNFFSEEEKPE